MFTDRCFEFGNDITVFHDHLHASKRSLRRGGSSANLLTCNQHQCKAIAYRISCGMQNEYPDSVATGATGVRLYNALFSDMIRSSGAVDEADLMYFEVVFDNCPRVGWGLFVELVAAFGWRENLVQSLKALSPKVRLVMLEAMYSFTTTTPYIWGCVTSMLIWSSLVEPVQGFDASHDEALSALSKVQFSLSSDEVSPTVECLLEGCVQVLAHLSEDSGLSHSEVADWASALVHVALDFLGSLFEPTDSSLFTLSHWPARRTEVAKKAAHTFYVEVPPRCRVASSLAWPQIRQLLDDADSLLFKEITGGLSSFLQEGLFQDERAKHALCTTHGFCATRLAVRSKKKAPLPSSTEDGLWHLVKKLQCLLSCLESLEEGCEEQGPLLESLKGVVQKWDCGQEAATPGPQLETLIPDVERLFKDKVGAHVAALVIWTVKQERLLQCERVVDKLSCHVDMLSHPELFPLLCQAALREGANESVKKLVLKTCDSVHLKLQEAMLFYFLSCGTYSKTGSPLMLPDFCKVMFEKRSIISEASAEEQVKAVSGLASLCMQSPNTVVTQLVDMAVMDECVSAAALMLIFLEVACKDQTLYSSVENTQEFPTKLPKIDVHKPNLLGTALLEAFKYCRSTKDQKRKDNFVHLLDELVAQSSVVPCDWFLRQIVHYIEQAAGDGLSPELFFTVVVLMVIAPKISKYYVAPVGLMLIDLLDTCCRHMNGAHKKIMVDALDAYLGFDASWATQIHVAHVSSFTRTAIALLFRKKGLPLDALAGYTEEFSAHLLLLDDEQWEKDCREIAHEHSHFQLMDVIRPYLTASLAVATSEDWEVIVKRLRTVLTIQAGTCPSTDTLISELGLCLVSCIVLKIQGNWEHRFLCFALVVKECVKASEDLSVEAKKHILAALCLVFHHLPKKYFRQELLLLADVIHRMDMPTLQEKLGPVFRAALMTQQKAEELELDLVGEVMRSLNET